MTEAYKRTAKNFVMNVQRAMRVAGGNAGDNPEKMTQETLSKKAGIARSTITNHKGLSASDEKSPNPTLEKICAIADTLNVPPAFLLMRAEDWVRIAQVVEYYASLNGVRRANPLLSELARNGNMSPTEQAKIALKFAKMLEIVNSPTSEALKSLPPEGVNDVLAKAHRQQNCIFASSSLPPINHMTPDERVAAFVFSVIFGASYRLD